MERLTYFRGGRWWINLNGHEYGGFPEVDRLAAYEDTGLDPDEITTEPYGCVFYCNRKCNLDGDFCAEGPGCPYEINAETAKHLLEFSQAEKDGRLVVLPVTLEQLRDPVKVVYCKDCKYLYFKDFSAFCPHRVGACKPDGFCEYGERRNP